MAGGGAGATLPLRVHDETATLELRDAGPDFAADLVELWTLTFREAYASAHSDDDIRAYCATNFTRDAARAALSDERTLCRIAVADGAPVGFFIVVHRACPAPLDGTSSELKQIYVRASVYGSGVGRALLGDAIERVRARQRSWIWLAVSDRNARAQAFYRRQSFAPVGAGPVLVVGADRLTSTLMARKLSPAA